MEKLVLPSLYFTTIVVISLVVAKIIIFLKGKRIRMNLIGFFWFSEMSIINSSSKESELKKLQMNAITAWIVFAILFELFLLMVILAFGNFQ